MPSDLPPLDAHAHIAADVTTAQVQGLGRTVVFAMTRSAKEATYALRPGAAAGAGLVWGLGSHPGVESTVDSFDEDLFARALSGFALIGEVGLDRRGDSAAQSKVFRAVLSCATDQPVLLSVHSTGRCAAVLDALERRPHPGVILHWFNGSAAEIQRAVDLGCFFSVNAAMSRATLNRIPKTRVLTETDFPSSRVKTGAARPGDVSSIEALLADQHGHSMREQVWINLAAVCDKSGATNRMPPAVQRILRSMAPPELI
jgi:TatD DNase family protein